MGVNFNFGSGSIRVAFFWLGLGKSADGFQLDSLSDHHHSLRRHFCSAESISFLHIDAGPNSSPINTVSLFHGPIAGNMWLI